MILKEKYFLLCLSSQVKSSQKKKKKNQIGAFLCTKCNEVELLYGIYLFGYLHRVYYRWI